MKRGESVFSKMFWTEREDALLKKHYADLSREQLERLLKRSINSIRYRASVVLKLRRVDPKKLPWTKEEDRTLKRLFPSAGWSEIQRALKGRTIPSISSRARSIGLCRRAPGRAPWTKQDEEILRKNFSSVPRRKLAEMLGRTNAAINFHAQSMGLHRPRNDRKPWTKKELDVLAEKYSACSWDELEKLLPGRSRTGISSRARAMGLSRAQEYSSFDRSVETAIEKAAKWKP